MTTATLPCITGADYRIIPDARDEAILAQRQAAFDAHDGPRVGDWLRFRDGSMERFSHHWGDGLQTSTGGSWYLADGYGDFSGGLNPIVPLAVIHPTEERAAGRFWFFHHDFPHAHSAVHVELQVRVYETPLLPYR